MRLVFFCEHELTIYFWLLAVLAKPGWGSWTLGGSVALLLAEVASAHEGTSDLVLGTVRLRVANLAAVEAFAHWLCWLWTIDLHMLIRSAAEAAASWLL